MFLSCSNFPYPAVYDIVFVLDPLAYLTAQTNGHPAADIFETAGLTESDIDDVPTFGASTLKSPPVVTSTTNLNWPSVAPGTNFFNRATAALRAVTTSHELSASTPQAQWRLPL